MGSPGSYDVDALDETAAEIERLKGRGPTAQHEALWREKGLASNMDVLDLGCGPGLFSMAMGKLVQPGRVVGVDYSKAMIAEATKLAQADGVDNVSFQQSSIEELAFPADSFDFVWARLFFQHIRDPAAAMSKILGWLKPGGTLCVVDADREFVVPYPEPPTWAALYERIQEAQSRQGGDPCIGRKLGTYMVEAGYSDVNTQMISDILRGEAIHWFADNVLTSFLHMYGKDLQSTLAETITAFHGLADRPSSFLYHIIFLATGRRSAS